MRDRTAEVRVTTQCQLGEGPQWDEAHQRLLWLDIEGRVLHALPSHTTHRTTQLEQVTSFIGPTRSGRLVAAGEGEVRLTDPAGATLHSLATLPMGEGTRTNDGACDPQGRLWLGTVDEDRDRSQGALFRIDGAGEVEVLRTGLALSNGIDWSPEGRVAYHVDTAPKRIDRLELDAGGDIIVAEPFVRTELMPDGLAVDEEGGVWIAFWDGGAVHRYSPEGELDEVVHVEAGRVTSCAFGAPGTTELYITTARQGMTSDDVRAQPASGALFAVDVGVGGRGVTAFADRMSTE